MIEYLKIPHFNLNIFGTQNFQKLQLIHFQTLIIYNVWFNSVNKQRVMNFLIQNLTNVVLKKFRNLEKILQNFLKRIINLSQRT